MKNNKKLMKFFGIAIALTAILVTPAFANYVTAATATANCTGYSVAVTVDDLSPGTSYTIDYTFTVTSSGGTQTFSGTITFTATASTATETASGSWSLPSSATVTGTATITTSGSTLPITINGLSSAALSCGGGDGTVYLVNYFSNANTTGAPDAVVRVINDGTQATAAPDGYVNGTLWAAIYVFDDSQEMISCCACQITSDGELAESVNKQLTINTFSSRGEFSRGVVKIISSSSNDPTAPVPVPGLRAWLTHVQATTNLPEKSPWFVSETPFVDSNLSSTELANDAAVCSYGLQDNSGYGLCPCTLEDFDF